MFVETSTFKNRFDAEKDSHRIRILQASFEQKNARDPGKS